MVPPWWPWVEAGLAAFGAVCLIQLVWSSLVRGPRRRDPAPPGVVVILRNQAAAVEPLAALLADAARTAPVSDLVLVDDGSTDATATILQRVSHRYPGVRVVRLESRAKGSAADVGLFLCRSRVAVVAVCDGRLPALDVGRQVARLLGGPPRADLPGGDRPSGRTPQAQGA